VLATRKVVGENDSDAVAGAENGSHTVQGGVSPHEQERALMWFDETLPSEQSTDETKSKEAVQPPLNLLIPPAA
jgi:hypothetical protein